jgi:Tfp pilus assembly protein FimT
MKKIQYGFSVLETLLIVVIISIIGSIGWYVINQNNDSGNDQTSATVVNDASNYSCGFKNNH